MLDWTLQALTPDDLIALMIVLCYFAVPIGGLCWIALAGLASEADDAESEADDDPGSAGEGVARGYAWAASGDGGGDGGGSD